jgi:hypothetical protein
MEAAMANYNRLEIQERDKAELLRLKAYFPFRKWFIVKAELQETAFFDSLAKAKRYAKDFEHVAIYRDQSQS